MTSSAGLAQGIGEVNWAAAYWPNFEFDTWYDATVATRNFAGMNGGISGNTTADVLARCAAMLARRPSVVLVSVGTNDVGASVAASTAMANLQAICGYFTARGVKVILSNIRPRGSSSIPDGDARLTILSDLNALISAYAAATPNVTLWDAYAAYDDGAGRPVSGLLSDGIHPSRRGAQIAGRSLATVIASVMADQAIAQIPTPGALMSNDIMAGTGGTASTGSSGSMATGYTFTRVGGGTSTAVLSKNGSDFQQAVISPQAAGIADEAWLIGRQSGGAPVSEGMWIRTYARVKLSAWDGWRFIGHQGTRSVGLATVDAAAVMDMPEEDTFDIIGPPYLVPTGVTSISMVLRIDVDGTKTGSSGTLTIERFGVYQIDNPIATH